MNSFGTIFRVTVFGESHGTTVGVTIDGCAPGIPLSVIDFANDLDRRKGGIQKGTTPRAENDEPVFLSGVFNDKTTGAPLTIIFENKNVRSADYEKLRSTDRPGHADFTADKKFKGFNDYRGGGHFSGRLTLCIVAAGVVAKKMIAQNQPAISIEAKLIAAGGEKDIDKAIQKAIDAGDSIGGIVECRAKRLPVGLGEPFFNSLESLISHAAFAIPAVKGIEFGAGFAAAKMFGSEHNDVFVNDKGATKTNNAGGISGGLSNGNELIFRVVVKPPSSTPVSQHTYNKETGEMENFVTGGRHDLCIALRVPPVLEAVTAIVLADLMQQVC